MAMIIHDNYPSLVEKEWSSSLRQLKMCRDVWLDFFLDLRPNNQLLNQEDDDDADEGFATDLSRGRILVQSEKKKTHYKAAVYEHVPVGFEQNRQPTVDEGKDILRKNLRIYEEQVQIAARHVSTLQETGNT